MISFREFMMIFRKAAAGNFFFFVIYYCIGHFMNKNLKLRQQKILSLKLHIFFLGELKEDSGLGVLAKQFEIDVDEVGVEGAKTFFEAKVGRSKSNPTYLGD